MFIWLPYTPVRHIHQTPFCSKCNSPADRGTKKHVNLPYLGTNRGGHLNVLYLVFYELSVDASYFKTELEISPFLTVVLFYSNIVEKCVGKSPQEISTGPTFRNILTNLKRTR